PSFPGDQPGVATVAPDAADIGRPVGEPDTDTSVSRPERNSGYASSPHSPRSTPSYSSCSDTRIPITSLITNQATKAVAKTHAKIVTSPRSCAPRLASGLDRQTASKPQMPTTPWTEIAPTGSSILNTRSSVT